MDDVRLPIDVERGAQGGPQFKTTVVSMASGHEQRNQEWSRSRAVYQIGYGIRDREDMEEVYAFFLARRGRHRAFRFRDWLDFSGEAEPLLTVAGQPTKRQLVKTYGSVMPYVREITLPVLDTLKIYVGGVETNAYTIDRSIVTFTGGDPGVDVKASFEFDVPVRFDQDGLETEMTQVDAGSVPSIAIVEVRL